MIKKFENVDNLLYPAHSSTLDSCVLQGCVKGVSRVFQGSFMGVSRVFQGCFKGVSWVFQGCSKGVARIFTAAAQRAAVVIMSRSLCVYLCICVSLQSLSKRPSSFCLIHFSGAPQGQLEATEG